MRLKSKRKHYECDICDKIFNNYSVMVVHKRIHFGEKPYTCMNCEEGFGCLSHFKTHYQKHQQKNLDSYVNYDVDIGGNISDQNTFSNFSFRSSRAQEIYFGLLSFLFSI